MVVKRLEALGNVQSAMWWMPNLLMLELNIPSRYDADKIRDQTLSISAREREKLPLLMAGDRARWL